MPQNIEPVVLSEPASHQPCTSYAAGHTVHFIQALHSHRPENAVHTWSGELVDVDGEVISIRNPAGAVIRYRNHDAERLLAGHDAGVDVAVNDRFAILRSGTRCFSIASDRGVPLDPCATDPARRFTTAAQIVQRLDTHGGVVF